METGAGKANRRVGKQNVQRKAAHSADGDKRGAEKRKELLVVS